ncbi:TAF6-like RNA polymerase II p300/CBP-associated factor-associated factor 65 kDa subunit 6L [Haliotis cracherodii]|uniref:TAF6-like RNA polymerase II p300/CBP-associated factor-associated factor 65 kDa subunit 6L n=1 Tax=Haliotis cracherodii TaxID=6455 RepID=UPI0039E82EC9
MNAESMVTSPTEEKKPFDEKKYAIITKETVKMMAEAAGHADLPDAAAALLGEDLSYRLREVTMNCTQFMRHAKRKRMTTDDFNKALRQSDVQPLFGHGSMEPANFRQTRDGELHFVEDMDVNLANIAFNTHIPKHIGETTIKAHWLVVEGVQKTVSSSQPVAGKLNVKKELSDDLLKYYENMTKAILGCDVDTMKTALTDLQSNPNIVPLLPYFVNFVANGVKTVSHDLCQLTKLLHTVKALVHNPHVYLEPQPYLNLLVQAVLYCVLEPLAASIYPRNDHWLLRDYAARLLAQIVTRWSSPLNHLRYNTEKNLKETLHDLTKPHCSHYGAIMGLLSLGCKQVEEIIVPHLSSFMPRLCATMEDLSVGNAISRADAFKVHGALLLAAELVLKRRNNDFEKQYFQADAEDSGTLENSGMESVVCKKTPCEIYKELYEYFGDSLSRRMPEPKQRHMFKPEKKEEMVKLFEGEGAKSGEQLLEDFMEQVRIQQKLEKERREREEKERREREKIEMERRERERIERMKREEEERRQRVIQERLRREEEEKRRKLYEEQQRRQDEMRRVYEEKQRREIEKQTRLYEESQRTQFPDTRRRIPRQPPVTYPNEDEEDDDDFLMEEEEEVHGEADSEYSLSGEEGGSGKREKWDEESEESEEKSEEESFEEPQTMAVTSISDPNKGIKLKIKRQPGLKLQIKRDKVSIREEPGYMEKPVEKHKDKESKHKRKRKTQKSPKDHDPFEFTKADPNYATKVTYTPSHIYSSPGGESSGSDNQFRKSKLTLKLKVPSKESTSE